MGWGDGGAGRSGCATRVAKPPGPVYVFEELFCRGPTAHRLLAGEGLVMVESGLFHFDREKGRGERARRGDRPRGAGDRAPHPRRGSQDRRRARRHPRRLRRPPPSRKPRSTRPKPSSARRIDRRRRIHPARHVAGIQRRTLIAMAQTRTSNLGPAARPVSVPDDLEDRSLPKANGRVELPLNVRWSGPASRTTSMSAATGPASTSRYCGRERRMTCASTSMPMVCSSSGTSWFSHRRSGRRGRHGSRAAGSPRRC